MVSAVHRSAQSGIQIGGVMMTMMTWDIRKREVHTADDGLEIR